MESEFNNANSGRAYKVESDKPKEHYEILVVFVPQAVVYVYTVMVEFLYTCPAIVAMESPRRLNKLAVEAEILQVDEFRVGHLKQILTAIIR